MTQDNMNFTTGSIFRKLIGFMMPILGALLLQTMYGAVDILVVGWFGTDVGISAVSTGSSFINMIVFILNGLAMGVTVLMGRYIGEKNEKRLGKGYCFLYLHRDFPLLCRHQRMRWTKRLCTFVFVVAVLYL